MGEESPVTSLVLPVLIRPILDKVSTLFRNVHLRVQAFRHSVDDGVFLDECFLL